MATWQWSIQSAKSPLLPSTHAVTTSAWPGDTPWVNKWGACQSAHHNSSETHGEQGGSSHARLWFPPTVLLLVQTGPDHSAWLCHAWLFGFRNENGLCSSRWCFSVLDIAVFLSDHVSAGLCGGSMVCVMKENGEGSTTEKTLYRASTVVNRTLHHLKTWAWRPPT